VPNLFPKNHEGVKKPKPRFQKAPSAKSVKSAKSADTAEGNKSAKSIKSAENARGSKSLIDTYGTLGVADGYCKHYRHYQHQRHSKLFSTDHHMGRLRFFFLFKGDFLNFFFLCTIVSCIATKNVQVQIQILQGLSIPFLVNLYQIIGSRIQCTKFQHLA
jgi:hypothetical protein